MLFVHATRLRLRMKLAIAILFFVPLALRSSALAGDGAASHPLDPLKAEEISAAAEVLQASGKLGADARLPILVLHEPPKAEVLAFKPGSEFRREAFAIVYNRETGKTAEAIIDLRAKKVASWNKISGVEPNFLLEEFSIAQEVVRADPDWQAAIRKRGVTDFKSIQVDAWSAGSFGFSDEEGKRMVRAVSYLRGEAKNPYSRPIEGLIAYVDLRGKKVVKLVDSGVIPIPKATRDFDQDSVGEMRKPVKPLKMEQPQGGSFTINGNEVSWQNWRFRFAMHPREGLVLYEAGLEDHGKFRSVLYRGSLSEMVVPYGDPSAAWFFRNAFDEGEYGVGRLANSLEPLNDAPNNAVFFNATFADDAGRPYEVPNAVALFERDGGVLWKHFDYTSGHNESRRARELVLSYITTVGNYEYGFNWVFGQDGRIDMEVILTGIMAARAVETPMHGEGGEMSETHGHVVDQNVEAVHHQHFMNFRLDLDVDGAAGNSLVEMNAESSPEGAANPYKNAFVMRETPLRKELDAKRQLNLASARKWKIINPAVRNALGMPVGYMLVPGENAMPYARPDSSVRRRAGFIDAPVWVTPYDAAEMNAAGAYVNQSKGGDGLAKWSAANRSIENQDLVLWYTMGTTHIPRPEEWPVMPAHKMGFSLVPNGFFARNPALDVPRQ